MTSTKQNIGEMSSIEEELTALQVHINDYRALLNGEGVWLFLATLGCWSVSNTILQLIAYVVAFLVFADHMNKKSKESKSFSKLVEIIKNKIENSIEDGDQKKARLYDLITIKSTEMSALKSFSNTKVFLVCWAFFGASFVYTLFNIPKHAVG